MKKCPHCSEEILDDAFFCIHCRLDIIEPSKLIFENNAYWIKKNKKREGPYCSRCYDVDKKFIHFLPLHGAKIRCPACGNIIAKPE